MVIGTKSTSADALLDASRKREAARKMFIVDVAVFRFILWQPKKVLSPLRAVVVEPRIQDILSKAKVRPVFRHAHLQARTRMMYKGTLARAS